MEKQNGNGKRPRDEDILEGEGVIVWFDPNRFRRDENGDYLLDKQGNKKQGQFGFIHRFIAGCDPMNCQEIGHEVFFPSAPIFKAIYHGNYFKLEIGTKVKFKAFLPRSSNSSNPVVFWVRLCEEVGLRQSKMGDPLVLHGR